MSYAAPIRDIRFALEEVVAIEGLKTTGQFDDLTSDLIAAVLEEAGRYASEVLAPLNRSGDEEGSRLTEEGVVTPKGFKEAYAQFAEGGWAGACFPEELGGMGLPRAMAVAISEMTQSANMSFGLCPMLTLGAIEALIAHASDELKDRFLPKLLSGEWTGAMDLTEPQAGSDLSAVRTKATPRDDGSYAIEGQKIFITWGDHDCAPNVVHLVLARIDGAPEGTRGLSLFVVPKFVPDASGAPGEANNVRCIGLEKKLGIHASPTCTMEFSGATGWLVGQEHCGLAHMFTMMNSARINVGVQGVGVAERAFQQAVAFAKERRQGKTPGDNEPARIIEHPDVRRMLLTMKSKIEAARAICYAAAVAADYAEYLEDPDDRKAAAAREALLTPIAKAWSTDFAVEAASLNIQVHGGMGFVEETGAAQHYRDARITPIYEGTNGIQAIDLIRRKLTSDGGRAMRDLIEDIRETAESLALSSNEQLPALAEQLADGADALERCVDWLLDEDRDPQDVLAAAEPFMRMTGDVVGGHFLGLSALAAQRRLKEGQDNPDFAQAKIDIARFYAENILSAAPGLIEPVTAGAGVLFDVAEEFLSA